MTQLPFPEPDYKPPDQLKFQLQNLSEPDFDDTLQCQSKRRNGTIVLLIEKPPEVSTPTASDTTRETSSQVAERNRNTSKSDSTIPKSGYGFFELVIKLFLRHSDVNGGGMLGHWGGVKLYHLVCSCPPKKSELSGQHKCPCQLLREMPCRRVGQQMAGRKVLMQPILREARLKVGR